MDKIYNIKIEFPYITQRIFIGSGILDFSCKKILSQNYDKLIVVVDRNLYKLIKIDLKKYLGEKVVDIVFVKPIVKYKEFGECREIIAKMVLAKMNRNCCLVAIGGGYVGDLAGFVAANYMRGIDFVQIPTTVMSMSDAIIGKVAINFNGIKNLLGSFYSPRYTFCDVSFLKTLNKDEIVLGLVEIWKHSLLVNSRSLSGKITECLKGRLEPSVFLELINSSLKIKKRFVENDYNDKKDVHKALSLGHTFANYLEQKLKLRHGQAVFYGIVLETLLSLRLKVMDQRRYDSIRVSMRLFEKKINLLGKIQGSINANKTINKLKFDKINHGDFFTFVLLTNTSFCVKRSITSGQLKKVLSEFTKLVI